ncbi:MAG: hypothetical protein WBE58_11310 [Verrucomicrobiales bacterium]
MNLALRGIEADIGPEHADTSAATAIPISAPTGNFRMPKCECGIEKP